MVKNLEKIVFQAKLILEIELRWIIFNPPNLISLIAAERAILSGPFHRKFYMIVLSCFTKSCEAGRTEYTYSIFGSKRDLMIVTLPNSERTL